MKKQKVVCYVKQDSLGGYIFTTFERGEYVTAICKAINTAKTFGEFFKLLPSREVKVIKQGLKDNDHFPEDEDFFDPMILPGFGDGDYPPWLATEVPKVLPSAILEKYGVKGDSFLNGSCWAIPAAHLKAALDELTALGIDHQERADFVLKT